MKDVKNIRFLLAIVLVVWLVSAFVSKYAYANGPYPNCNTAQNMVSEAVNHAVRLQNLWTDQQCVEDELGGVGPFFDDWISRWAKITGFSDEAALFLGPEIMCANYLEHAGNLTDRFYRLVDDAFRECFAPDVLD